MRDIGSNNAFELDSSRLRPTMISMIAYILSSNMQDAAFSLSRMDGPKGYCVGD
ncbi:MAG: hypothetical protein NVSMB14_01360 [Isosphaeraceae bacterium]